MKRTPRIVRLVWLAVLVFLDDALLFADYRRRFCVPMHAFRRDVKKVRRLGLYIYALLYGRYRLLFYLDSNPEWSGRRRGSRRGP
jgi:hypothetical protein